MQLIHGDCLEKMKDIPDKSIDMILCDLPYGTTRCRWDVVIPFEPLWEQYKRIIKDRGAIVLFGSQPFTSALVMSNPKQFKHSFIWDKKSAANVMLAKKQPLKVHEDILIFSNGVCSYYPQMIVGKMRKKGGAIRKKSGLFAVERIEIAVENDQYYPKTILEFSNASQVGKVHPTQKPTKLLEYLIRTYTLEGETVLDNTMGSGSTGCACLNTKRNFIGIEKDDKYFEIAKNRINNHLYESLDNVAD